MSKLIEMIKEYEELRARKEELADQVKENNQAYKKIQEEIVDQMIEDDIPSQGYGDYTYSPQIAKHFSFISEAKLAERGLDKIEVMRENGFDFLIKETINPRSMESTFKEMLENDEEIPEEVMAIITDYEEQKITRRKSAGSGLKKAKKAKEE